MELEDAHGNTSEMLRMRMRERHADLKKIEKSANWFLYIAGISAINTLMIWIQAGWVFIIGLGATQIIDRLVLILRDDPRVDASEFFVVRIIGIFLDIGLFALFCSFAVFARRGRRWVFLLGLFLYGLDSVLFIGDWIGLIFHGFTLFQLYEGYDTLRRIKANAANQPV
jgi:hypothetical protein